MDFILRKRTKKNFSILTDVTRALSPSMAARVWIASPLSYGRLAHRRFPPPDSSLRPRLVKARSLSTRKLPTFLAMEMPAVSPKQMPKGIDAATEEEYAFQSKLLQQFTNISTIDKAWVFKYDKGNSSQAMFSISQANLIGNKRRKYTLSCHISKGSDRSVAFEWSPFPVEMTGVSAIVPSPSGLKLFIVRNGENGSPTQLEIWGSSQLLKEIHVPQSVHGQIYTDGWFEGISWNHDETLIAYVAEEPSPSRPAFDGLGYKKGASIEKDCGSWKGEGEWEEDWGETYSGKRQPRLFVVNIDSGDVRAVEGVEKSLSVGQVVWAPPSSKSSHKYLVFVGWTSDNGPSQVSRKLGIKYCYNRPCALYAVRAPFYESDVTEDSDAVVNLTQGLSSAFFPQFSPDGKSIVFLSVKSAVDSGAHWATETFHRMDWPAETKPCPSMTIVDVVPVVMCPEEGCFPGLYCSRFVSQPWLSDGHTIIMTSVWGSIQVVLAVDVLSCKVSRISPAVSTYSWDVLAVDGDNILTVCSSPINPPQIKYGCHLEQEQTVSSIEWDWIDVSSPLSSYPEKVLSLLSSLECSIMKIPVRDVSNNLAKGARNPFEAIFVSHSHSSAKKQKEGSCNPLIVVLHGGPHSVSLSSYSKSLAFLSSLGYNLLIVNYRGSLGFGEEALQSLPGKVGSQDVNDVFTALDHAIEMGLVDPSKVAVLGGSHGGFLTTHLIGQAPDRFSVAAARNPACNLALMVGTTDIPDWCFVEAYGSEGKKFFTEAPSVDHLSLFHSKSPISHLSKVKTPVLFLLGAQDLRVPISNGLQYARALKEKGVKTKVIVFPNDVHGIERPQSDFESYLNIGVWFKQHCN